MTSGIYLLNFDGTHKVYIGQSNDIEYRYIQHKTKFTKNKHSIKLQEAYNIYGMPWLEILEECSENINDRENYYIKLYNSVEDGFNTQEEAGSWPIQPGDSNPQSKYSNEQIELAFMMLVHCKDMSCQDISNESGVSRGMVKMISRGASHTWLKDKYPEEYSILVTTKNNNSRESIYKHTGYPPLISPEGVIYNNITNVKSFCEEHGLTQVRVSAMYLGRQAQHKGWKIYNVNVYSA